MSVQYYRYIGSGPENDEFMARLNAMNEAACKARKALTDEYGAEGLIMNWWDKGKPEGIYFTEKKNLPFLKGETKGRNGEYAYYPKLSTKMGKELKRKLDDPAVIFSASKVILDELKLHRTAFDGRIIASSFAGCSETNILVSIPAGENALDCMPEVPVWLQEVKESEWQAAQGN